MRNPWIIALASVAPGLGFALMGRFRQAILSVLAVLALLVVCFVSRSQVLLQVSGGFMGLAWLGQAYLAFDEARRGARIARGEASAPQEQMPLAAAPPGTPRSERLSYRVRQAVEQQLLPGERFHDAVFALAPASLASHALLAAAGGLAMRQYYVALSDQNLVLIQLDMWGKPAEVRRHPRDQVRLASHKEGLLNDRLILDIGSSSPIRIQAPRSQRKHTVSIANGLRTQM